MRSRGIAKVVLTSGAFDIIHPGHIKMLEEAKKLGGRNSKLIVVIARDETVRKNKGRKPIFSEIARLRIVNALKPVDRAVLGFKPLSFEKIMKKYKPDIVVFGYDQKNIMKEFKKLCKLKGWKVIVKRLRKYSIGSLNSSSQVIKKIKRMVLEEYQDKTSNRQK